METTFKVGQKVWDNALGFGEGEVERILQDYPLPLIVNFGNDNIQSYTIDGRWSIGKSPTLSTTPYTLSGFSQEPVKEESFSENRWYKGKHCNAFGLFRQGEYGVGFRDGKWSEQIGMQWFGGWQLIDDSNGSELKELLTKEAVRRGAVKGCKLAETGINANRLCCKTSFSNFVKLTFKENLSLITNGWDGFVFSDGNWAEIDQPFLYAGKTGIGKIDGREFEFIIKEVK